MVCGSPTPPPLLRMQLKIHAGESGRFVLDSKPLVVNENGYCDKVGFGDWKFCETRPEGHPEREACDYLVTGKAQDTGRWGPTWYYDNALCASVPGACGNHGGNQFLAIAKDEGEYRACAAAGWPLASNGTRCAARSRFSSGPDDAQRPRSRARIDFGRGHWHRFSGGTPRRACSTCAPQPAHVGFPHCVQRTWWHISPPPRPRTTTAECGRRGHPRLARGAAARGTLPPCPRRLR